MEIIITTVIAAIMCIGFYLLMKSDTASNSFESVEDKLKRMKK